MAKLTKRLGSLVLFLILCLEMSAQIGLKKNKDKNYDLLYLPTKGGAPMKISSIEKWQLRKEQILRNMQMAMGALPSKKEKLKVVFTDTLIMEAYTRYTMKITVAPNEVVPAYLYLPKHVSLSKKSPAMLVLHPTGDSGKALVDGKAPRPNRAHAKELAERGYIVLAPDFPGYGESRDYDFTNDRYVSGSMKGVFNHIRCIDYLAGRKEVDPERIGVIGHSLGGYNAIFAGAFDKRLKVVVSSSGWTLFDYYNPWSEEAVKKHGGRLGPWAQEVHMPLLRDQYNLDGSKFPFDFHEAIATIAPRAFFSNSPQEDYFNAEGVKVGISALSKVYELFNAKENLQVRYPEGGHDFPSGVRREAYQFIDKVLKHAPLSQTIE